MSNNKTYRIRTKVGESENTYLNVQLSQDIDTIEVLSLNINTENSYKLQSSNYGCIAGRVLANKSVGIPNAKISVFIKSKLSPLEASHLYELYPYTTTSTSNANSVRYNLLPSDKQSKCHQNIGSMPSKRMMLDDNSYIEIFNEYYTYTTRTNDSGDYMLFGVPVGEQILHVDVDLSDIGFLSQTPRDLIYKGSNANLFENPSQFKKSNYIDTLAQVITQNKNITVKSFWGDNTSDDKDFTIGITRCDIDIQYDFTPTCVFMGSVVTEDQNNGISKRCLPTEDMGRMKNLITGPGTIEIIRKTADGDVEELTVQGNQVIDGDGVWCYQIPMNLDFMSTDEYGNLIPTDDASKGIATRARVRFRVSMDGTASSSGQPVGTNYPRVLIPNNPKEYEDLDYAFGTSTKESSFKDLFWNNVYTVKSYIPRIQRSDDWREKRFSGIKDVSRNEGKNSIPYNNMRVRLSFNFTLQCAILKAMIRIISFVNKIKSASSDTKCVTIGDGLCPDLQDWYFAPGCSSLSTTLESLSDTDGNDPQSTDNQNSDNDNMQNMCITNKIDYLMQCVEINLAMEEGVIKFDFYNDWINGLLYIPKWHATIKKKRSYLFGLIRTGGGVNGCMEETFKSARRFVQQCAVWYKKDTDTEFYTKISSPAGCTSRNKQKCHQGSGLKKYQIFRNRINGGGIVHSEETLTKQKVFYMKPAEWTDYNNKSRIRTNLYCTDIVLLGSLIENNQYGIPSPFNELTYSTYTLPTNLAKTNMDAQGPLYTFGSNGSYCSGRIIGSMKLTREEEPKQESYESWIKHDRTADYDPIEAEEEYPVTEVSGIDWGYSGPYQGGGSLKRLFFPGGHFLGIACAYSAVNIKSCVNLARACEIGTTLSQRTRTPYKIDDKGNLTYNYFVPNGLISYDEIESGDFRQIFATLNFNGLETMRDKNSKLLRYKFTALYPNNFNGELENHVKNDDYNRIITKDTDPYYQGHNYDNQYMRSLEETSHDYYRFRLGHADNYATKYLLHNNNNVALPMYDNSFYFYFGLNNGKTAYHKFMKEFYYECKDMTDYDPGYETKITGADYCTDNDGSIEITLKNVEPPYVYSLYKFNTNNLENDYLYSGITVDDIFTISELASGTYILTLNGNNTNNVNIKFDVPVRIPDTLSGITVTPTDFKKPWFNINGNNEHAGVDGYLTVDFANGTKNITKIFVSTEEGSNPTQVNEQVTSYNIYVNEMNEDYEVSVEYDCGNNTKKIYNLGVYQVNYAWGPDVVFGDNDVTYKKVLEPLGLVGNNEWYNVLLDTSVNGVTYNANQGYYYKQNQNGTVTIYKKEFNQKVKSDILRNFVVNNINPIQHETITENMTIGGTGYKIANNLAPLGESYLNEVLKKDDEKYLYTISVDNECKFEITTSEITIDNKLHYKTEIKSTNDKNLKFRLFGKNVNSTVDNLPNVPETSGITITNIEIFSFTTKPFNSVQMAKYLEELEKLKESLGESDTDKFTMVGQYPINSLDNEKLKEEIKYSDPNTYYEVKQEMSFEIDSNVFDEKQLWTLKRALFFDKSMFDGAPFSQNVYTTGGSPLIEEIEGFGGYITATRDEHATWEIYVHKGNSLDKSPHYVGDSYDLTLSTCFLPTIGWHNIDIRRWRYFTSLRVFKDNNEYTRFDQMGLTPKHLYLYNENFTITSGTTTESGETVSNEYKYRELAKLNVTVPSLYCPFYFNAMFCAKGNAILIQWSIANGITVEDTDGNHYLNKIKIVVNKKTLFITPFKDENTKKYNGTVFSGDTASTNFKLGKIEIGDGNGKELEILYDTNKVKETGKFYILENTEIYRKAKDTITTEDKDSYEELYPVITGKALIVFDDIIYNINAIFEVTDGSYDGYNSSIQNRTINESQYAQFATKDVLYQEDPSIQYRSIKSGNVNENMNNVVCHYGRFDEQDDSDSIDFEKEKTWQGLYLDAFGDSINMNSWLTFGANRVLAISDVYTRSGDYIAQSNKAKNPKFRFQKVPKHTNNLTICKIYEPLVDNSYIPNYNNNGFNDDDFRP